MDNLIKEDKAVSSRRAMRFKKKTRRILPGRYDKHNTLGRSINRGVPPTAPLWEITGLLGFDPVIEIFECFSNSIHHGPDI